MDLELRDPVLRLPYKESDLILIRTKLKDRVLVDSIIRHSTYSGDLNTGLAQYSQGWFSHVFEMLVVQDLSLSRKLGVVCYYKGR